MLDVQVDEFTLVLQSNKLSVQIQDWEENALEIIYDFITRSNVEKLLGELKETNNALPLGYSNGFVCDDAPYYFAIAYHNEHTKMGVCIKFSAYAWMEYRNNYHSNFSQSLNILCSAK